MNKQHAIKFPELARVLKPVAKNDTVISNNKQLTPWKTLEKMNTCYRSIEEELLTN